MVFEEVEKLKQQYTDQYVVVDATRPELARFRGSVGRVKTVNMSGRALVEFLDYHKNIGWYDIDPQFLTIVDEPPKAEAAPSAGPSTKNKPVAKPPSAKPPV